MKNKIPYIILAVIFIVAVIITLVKGLNVDLYYGEGYTISVTEKDTINVADIKNIAKEIWGDNVLVQKLEFFNDSVEIKAKEVNDEQLTELCNKLNEKYSSELEVSSFKVDHVSNVRLRNLVEPYIIPAVLSLLLVMAFYAIRYRGAREMLKLLIDIVTIEGLYYSLYAICRIPFSTTTIPLAMALYAITVLKETVKREKIQEKE